MVKRLQLQVAAELSGFLAGGCNPSPGSASSENHVIAAGCVDTESSSLALGAGAQSKAMR